MEHSRNEVLACPRQSALGSVPWSRGSRFRTPGVHALERDPISAANDRLRWGILKYTPCFSHAAIGTVGLDRSLV